MREERISLNDVSKRTLDLGYVGEENHTQVVIVCTSMFKKYPAATVTMVAKPPVGDLYPVTLTRDDNTVIWNVSPGDIAYAGSGQFQLTFANGTEIIKREYGSYSIKPSLAATGEPPEPIEDWIQSVNQAVQGKLDAPSTPGTDGQFLATDGEGGVEWRTPSGGGGTSSYTDLSNKPQINSVTLSGNKSLSDLGVASAADMSSKAPVVIDNASGAVATFVDGSDGGKIESLKLRINPVQSGTGDPSPTNVRAISGSTGLTISHSDEDTGDPTDYAVSWQSGAGTVYYGTLNATTGTLTVESFLVTFDGSSDESWTYFAYNEYNKYRYYISVSGAAYGDSRQDIVACNWLKPVPNGVQSNYTFGTNIIDISTSKAWVFIALDVATVDALKTALAQTPLTAVIRLATPQTYSINPVAISTLSGVNNIWTNVGEVIECKYQADTKGFVKEEIASLEVEPHLQTTSASLLNGTIKVVEDLYIRKNVDIDLKGYITSFTSLAIGHGYNVDGGAYIVVDSTNVTVYADNAVQKEQYAHGLTLGTYIHVLIQQGDDSTANITISSLSGQYKKTGITFNGCTGDIFATASGTLTNVTLTAVLHDLNKDIWMFGDSYQSLSATGSTRYPYYMRADGYLNNCLFSGVYGAFSQWLVPSFKKLVAMKTPKYVVWCLGTNGNDNESINIQWKLSVEEVIEICEEKGITLILETVPCTPGRDQTYKNTFVRESGLRYVDFAKAVGAETAESTWYTGMLADDDLHPTATGAMALYAQLLADVPEVMRNVKRSLDVWEGGSY